MSRRTLALLVAFSLLASLFLAYGAAIVPERAQATFATGGVGHHRGSIDWFEWGSHADPIPAGGLTKTNTRTTAGRTVVTTCTISNISGKLMAYRPGNWTGDGLDDLYNVGGTGTSNQIVSGLANSVEGAKAVTFSFSCGVKLDGVTVPLQGLVVADAEQSDTNKEYIQATPDQPNATWRIIDRYRDPACQQQTTANLNGKTLKLWAPDAPLNGCNAGPMAVGFMDGATSAKVELKGGGRSAIALGVMLSTSDYGDAPVSYGEAGALLETTWDGGTLKAGDTKVSTNFALATQSQSVPRLGTVVDGEPTQLHSADATGDDKFGSPADNPVNDEDGVGPLGTINVTPGGTYQKSVTCTGPGFVAGWIDWNRNGTFDPGERAPTVECSGTTKKEVTLSWNVPADTVSSLGANLSFMRLRIARTADQVLLPTGTSTSGEVEDHKLNIALPALTITKTSNATANPRPGDKITWTVKAANNGPGIFTTGFPARLVDDLTGVLDDATYNNDAVVTPATPGVSYSSPRLSWTGVLAVGASVTLTYSTTIKAGGDGTLRNVAWQPTKPTNPPTPACSAPAGGIDAATGEPCATATVLLPKLSVAKTANRTELPQKGDKVTYTVTVTNNGPGTYTGARPATASDDLSQVLDAATYDGNATATVGSVSYAASKLSWSGALAAGRSATITYSVTYTAGGDQSLVNNVCVPESEQLPGGRDGCAKVTILGSNLATSKTVTTPDVPARAGSVLTYTLRFQNTGKSAATVSHDDVLTGVVDDATVGTDTASSGLTVARVGDRLTVTGSVPVNGVATVTYTAAVKPDGTRGDNRADNFLVLAGQQPPSACVTDDPNCTSTPLPNVRAAKSADPATGGAVIAGQVVTYTLAFTNDGSAKGEVDYTDDLTDVLDDAVLGAVTVVPPDALEADTSTNGALRIRGSLAPGQTAQVNYTVEVKTDAGRAADAMPGLRTNLLANMLAPTGTTNPTCGEGLVDCTQNPVSSWTLAKTASPEAGDYVSPGDVITYTITAASLQGAIPAAVLSDDLTKVLNNATFVPGSARVAIDGAAAVPVSDPVDGTLTAGPITIPSGGNAVLTYSVTVGAEAWSETLRNSIVGTAVAPGAAATPFPPSSCFKGDENDVCSTQHLVTSHVFISKWGVTTDGVKAPVDGSTFEIRVDAAGAPGAVSGTVDTVVGETGRFEASPYLPGNYWLVEKKAPSGHTLLAEPVAFTIAVDGTLTVAAGSPQVLLDPSDPQKRTIRVADVAAIPLPLTGGGSVNFIVLAVVVLGIGAFGVTLIRRQRPLPTA